MISSGDKHNILSSLGKTPAKVSPYAPSPKDSDTHDDLLIIDSVKREDVKTSTDNVLKNL
jgi:hypothetical protein